MGAPLLAATDILLSNDVFRKIETLLKEKTGIRLADGGQKLVIARLSKHVKRLGLSGFDEYLQLVLSSTGRGELEVMINSLTTNTTHFFREIGHFQILETVLMPRLIAKARAGKRVRLWSAACSSGEEAFSMAATVLKCFPDVQKYDVRILATDVNKIILENAKKGEFEKRNLENIPSDKKKLMFNFMENIKSVKIREELRDLVSFRYLNFMEPWPVSGPFDVIFCRNVTIYMDSSTQLGVWQGLERVLDEEGVLFIGHSERIGPSLAHRLELFGPTSFCRPGRRPSNPSSSMEL